MKKLISFLSLLIVAMCSNAQSPFEPDSPLLKATQAKYPVTWRSDHSDNYHGIKVADPYNWLECDTCSEVEEWVKIQNKETYGYFDQIPAREKIRKRLTEIWSFESRSAPQKKGDKYFYFRNPGTWNHSAVYWFTQKDTASKLLLDPNTFSKDGTSSLTSFKVSPDGKYAAYGVSRQGSDWTEIFIIEIETGKKLNDHLKWVKFSGISWKGNGFFYSRYDAPKGAEYSAKNEYHKVYYHSLNTSQEKDLLIFADLNAPLKNFGLTISEKQDYAILTSSQGTSGNTFSIANIAEWNPGRKIDFVEVISGYDYDYEFIDASASGLMFLTNDDAPLKRVILVDPENPDRSKWKTLIRENEHVLESVHITKDKLILNYLENVSSHLYICNRSGEIEKEIELPALGTVNGITSSKKDNTIYYSIVSYTFPSRIYKVDVASVFSSLYFKPEIDFDSEKFVTTQVFYTSKDGTKIPMFITHKKDLKIDGNNPTFVFGYGGFNISYTPEFRVDRTVFLENGGIYCVPNIRGGGEFGEEWHKSGTKEQKQNVFDDFIAASEYLIKEGYTNSSKLAIHGRSNGGLLAGACLLQRPDLFACVIPQVGVLDMLKFHKFTIGWAWTGDYGCSDKKEDFEYLYKYSPVHNVKPGKYPATLVVTGDHDDRVVPAHSFKFISQLQFNQKGDDPVLIRIDTGGGHGSGKPLTMQIAEYTDIWTFVFQNTGMSPAD